MPITLSDKLRIRELETLAWANGNNAILFQDCGDWKQSDLQDILELTNKTIEIKCYMTNCKKTIIRPVIDGEIAGSRLCDDCREKYKKHG